MWIYPEVTNPVAKMLPVVPAGTDTAKTSRSSFSSLPLAEVPSGSELAGDEKVVAFDLAALRQPKRCILRQTGSRRGRDGGRRVGNDAIGSL